MSIRKPGIHIHIPSVEETISYKLRKILSEREKGRDESRIEVIYRIYIYTHTHIFTKRYKEIERESKRERESMVYIIGKVQIIIS